jgi:hypothetical protein
VRRTAWDAMVGAAAALLVFGAVPGVLVAFVGLPLPHHWNGHDVVSWQGLFDLLAIVSWCAWAACAWPILRSAAHRIRSGDVSAAVRPADRVAVRIALGALAVSSFLGLGASVAGAAPRRAPVASVSAALDARTATDARTAPVARTAGALRSARAVAHCVVGDGDTLAGLAAFHYGDRSAWTAIAAANLGRLMGDRSRFVDPSVLSAGWTLELPSLDVVSDLGSPAAPGGHAEGPGGGGVLPDGPALPIAELTASGISALVAALLARRARQLRRLRAFLREEGERCPAPSERETDLACLVAPFDHVPLVDLVEVAALHLGHALGTLDPHPGNVQWLRAGRDGVEARFSVPYPPRLPGWASRGEGSWLLPADVDLHELRRTLVGTGPFCSALLPLGDDDRGTWLLPVDAGRCLSVVGPRAAELVRAMHAAASSWCWNEDLVVTEDVAAASQAAGAQKVLFVGDPAALPPATRRASAVLTTRQVDDATVTVLVDARGASAHPLGLTVRPPLLDTSWTPAVEPLVAPDEAGTRRTSRPLVRHTPASTRRLADAGTGGPPDLFASAGASPVLAPKVLTPPVLPTPAADHRDELSHAGGRGRAEVRLLTAMPGVVGLQGDLPPKRARRAVELVAYLAAHAPDPVTGDRLRTRVLGSADSDAAAKTLFNTAGAARRALGVGPGGEPLLPAASRTGHYRLSSLVTLDASRACGRLRAGLSSRDPEKSVTNLREGLELIKGEPLAGVLTGYTWWRAEGHERRVADAVVDGACALVRAALVSDDIDLARWALSQARRVEPYSEALSRAAMRVAAASGDARRLHAEWRECRRQMDELDPGGVPTERTEQLYALLQAQLAGDVERRTSTVLA